MSLFTQKFPINRRAMALALEFLLETPALFTESYYSGLDGAHPLGIGWNKVQSVRGWMKASNLVEDMPRGEGSGARLTEFGRLIASIDPDLRRASTWWLIHIHLGLNTDATVYHHLFAFCERSSFRREEAVDIIKAHAKSVSTGSINADLDGILASFIPDGRLSSLGVLIRQDDQLLVRGRPEGLPLGLVAYVLLRLRDRDHPHAPSMSLRSLALCPGGLTNLLGLDDDCIRDSLRSLALQIGRDGFYFSETAGLDSVTYGRLSSMDILQRVLRGQLSDVVVC